MFVLRSDLAGVDWAAVKADLAKDGFDNGRTPEELLRRSRPARTSASPGSVIAWSVQHGYSPTGYATPTSLNR